MTIDVGVGVYGKIFETMFEGSMVGAKPTVWAVMAYVIAKQRPDRTVGSQVRLNPRLLAVTFGTTEKDVNEAIEYLCKPDPESTSKEEGGRRLVRLGEFEYRVVNGAKYRAVRDEEERRAQNREAQRRYRTKEKLKLQPDPVIRKYEEALERGDQDAADRIAEGKS